MCYDVHVLFGPSTLGGAIRWWEVNDLFSFSGLPPSSCIAERRRSYELIYALSYKTLTDRGDVPQIPHDVATHFRDAGHAWTAVFWGYDYVCLPRAQHVLEAILLVESERIKQCRTRRPVLHAGEKVKIFCCKFG